MSLNILEDYVKGKTVSIVGGAESILHPPNDSSNGDEIDRRDVVVRVCMEAPLEEQEYPFVGKHIDVIYCNDLLYKTLARGFGHDDKKRILGIPAIVQPYHDNNQNVVRKVIEDFGKLLLDGKCWVPMSGITCTYTACLAGAKEIYVSGFDFYRTSNRQAGKSKVFGDACSVYGYNPIRSVPEGAIEGCLGEDSWNNVIKDELAFREMVKIYPIKTDNVLAKILSTEEIVR